MPDITERYISEKNCDQVVAACRFAFKELNLNVEADYCEDGENHYLAAEEKYNFFFKSLEPFNCNSYHSIRR